MTRCSSRLFDTGAVLAVEWSENIENALPENAVFIKIRQGENEHQRIILIGKGEEFDEDIGD